MSGLSGELFVAAELLKRGLQTSVTFGNAKSIDLLAYNPATERTFAVQVKTIRARNYWPIIHSKVKASHVYVFVILNPPDTPVQYFIIEGAILANEPRQFGEWASVPDDKVPGIHPRVLEGGPYDGNWTVFSSAA